MRRGRVMVVDDDPLVLRLVSKSMEKLECDVSSAGSGEEAMELLEKSSFDLMFLDLMLPGMSGIEVLKETRLKSPATAVVVITAYGSVESARQALKLGASDFLEKPFNPEQLRMLARKAFEDKKAADAGSADQKTEDSLSLLVGNSRLMEEIRHVIERISRTRNPVLLTGEPGTGKEFVARLIHQSSDRAGKPFITADCGQASCDLLEIQWFGMENKLEPDSNSSHPGLFEQADKGTIFLGEIGELDPSMQPKLLRALQESEITRMGGGKPRPVDVRVISASRSDLKKMVSEKQFSNDLYDGLSAVPIHLPPLRERKQDLPLLITNILGRMRRNVQSHVNAVSPEYLEVLKNYDFPGNVFELEEIIANSVLLSAQPVLTPENLPREIIEKADLNELDQKSIAEGSSLKRAKALATERMESRLILRTLNEAENNFSEASRRLGISRSALYYKIKKFKIKVPD